VKHSASERRRVPAWPRMATGRIRRPGDTGISDWPGLLVSRSPCPRVRRAPERETTPTPRPSPALAHPPQNRTLPRWEHLLDSAQFPMPCRPPAYQHRRNLAARPTEPRSRAGSAHLPGGVTVARMTLDHLVEVQILAGQLRLTSTGGLPDAVFCGHVGRHGFGQVRAGALRPFRVVSTGDDPPTADPRSFCEPGGRTTGRPARARRSDASRRTVSVRRGRGPGRIRSLPC
jgi:hypothetical protein